MSLIYCGCAPPAERPAAIPVRRSGALLPFAPRGADARGMKTFTTTTTKDRKEKDR